MQKRKKRSRFVSTAPVPLFEPRTREANFLLATIMTTAKMLFVVVLLLGVLGSGMLVGMAKAWVETMPALDLSAFDEQAQTSFIYDKNEDLITTFKKSENRIDIAYAEAPQNLINAIIAVEDQRFWSHNGVDLTRLVGVVVSNLTKGNMQGGSTITQQLIKLTILSAEQTYKRKLQEAYLALELEKRITKQDILEEYMNVIYLGGSSYGVKVAAQDYFGKDVADLTLRECAALARLIRDPTYYNPRRCYYTLNRPAQIEDGVNHVLGLMLEQELITRAEYDQAMGERLTVLKTSPYATSEMYENVYYVEYAIYDVVSKMLRVEGLEDTGKNRSLMESKLRTGGYRIYTSLDPELQETVQGVVTNWNNYPKMRSSANSTSRASLGNGEYLDLVQPQAGVTVIDWHTGEIAAIVGGRAKPTGYKQNHRAYTIKMPVGSSIKPLSVYGPAFDLGHSPGTPVLNLPIQIVGWDSENGYPANYGGAGFTGVETMRHAITQSHNTATAHALMDYVGVENSVKYMLMLGISESRINKDGFGLALGSSGISTVEMAGAFAAIANSGEYLEPVAFSRVEYADGSIYIDAYGVQIRRQAFKPSTAYLLTDVLEEAVRTGTGTAARFGGFTVAGKTGTNSDYRGVTFAGMTGYYAAAVWIGHDDYEPLASGASGGTYAAPLWAAVMKSVHSYKGITADRPINTRSPADLGLIQVEVCSVSGMLPTAACRNDVSGRGTNTDYYLSGTEPTLTCNMHRSAKLCTKSMRLATSSCDSTRTYGVIYIPEGHPLRAGVASVVQQYFPSASTARDSANIGSCTICKNNAADDYDAANRYISRAQELMLDPNIWAEELVKLDSLISDLQFSMQVENLASVRELTQSLRTYYNQVRNRLD